MAVNDIPSILALDVAGTPIRWINYERAAYYYAKERVAWSLGVDDYTIWGGTRRIDGNRSSLTMNSIIAVNGMNTSTHVRGAIPPLTNRALFRRDKNLCAYCGEEFHAPQLTRDHVDPKSKGGKDIWTNVVTACGKCNKHKSDRTPERAGMQLIYVPYAPNRSEYLILMNRHILTDQMTYLLKTVPKHSRLHSV